MSSSLTCSVTAGPVAVMRPVRTGGSARRGPCDAVFAPSPGRWPGQRCGQRDPVAAGSRPPLAEGMAACSRWRGATRTGPEAADQVGDVTLRGSRCPWLITSGGVGYPSKRGLLVRHPPAWLATRSRSPCTCHGWRPCVPRCAGRVVTIRQPWARWLKGGKYCEQVTGRPRSRSARAWFQLSSRSLLPFWRVTAHGC